ncbi:MAG: TetR/AcrR family transcriptional regulator C-terminal domain-containing protein [Prolixibacteraceae bacterium]
MLDAIGEQTKYVDETKGTSVFEFIEKKLKNHFQIFQKNPALVSVVFAEDLFQNEPELVEKTRLKVEKSLSALSELIQQGQQSGEIRSDIDAGIISVMINGSLRMLVKQWKISGYSFSLISRGEKLIESYRLMLKNH